MQSVSADDLRKGLPEINNQLKRSCYANVIFMHEQASINLLSVFSVFLSSVYRSPQLQDQRTAAIHVLLNINVNRRILIFPVW